MRIGIPRRCGICRAGSACRKQRTSQLPSACACRNRLRWDPIILPHPWVDFIWEGVTSTVSYAAPAPRPSARGFRSSRSFRKAIRVKERLSYARACAAFERAADPLYRARIDLNRAAILRTPGRPGSDGVFQGDGDRGPT